MVHIEQALHKLLLHELYSKKEKCCFGSQQIQHLGHVISREGVSVDKDTITTILNWPIPKSVKDIRVKFIKKYGSIAAPLSDLVKRIYTYGISWL